MTSYIRKMLMLDRRLLLLAYEVLDHLETPPAGTTDVQMLRLLSRAFLDKATTPAKRELPPPKWRGGKPASFYSTPAIGTAAKRRAN
jgi:hypothetical protein